MEEIIVSVIVITYNQEKYIKKCLDSILKQKTSFNYEVIVHDDASTDNTANIIREYEKKYPNIIKPIYQSENQYSKHIKITKNYAFPKTVGKYIAFCEGDDYWISEEKLQYEFDVMEKNPNVSMCCHAVEFIKENGEHFYDNIGKDGTYKIKDILSNLAPYMHTATRLVKRDIYESMPEFFFKAPIGDLPMLLWSALNGEIYYYSKIMSAYRTFSSSSWSRRMFIDRDYAMNHLNSMIDFYCKLNDYTDKKFDKLIIKRIDDLKFNVYYPCGMYREAKNTVIYKKQSKKTKIIVNLGIVFPDFIYKLRKRKNLNA